MSARSDKVRGIAFLAFLAIVLVIQIALFGVSHFSWFWFLVCFVASLVGALIGHMVERFKPRN
ncbi:MAG: hypothetical protein AB7I57_02230 [Pirellulales bacterium]